MPFGEYLQRHIFQVAGMRATGLNSNTTLVPQLARLYCRQDAAYLKNPYINWDLNIGHDGLYSTASDLATFDQALRGTSLLSEASKTLMGTQHNQHFGGNGFFDHYGYGVFVDPYYNHGHHLLTHSGGYFGAMTTLDRYPQDQIFVTVLSNNEAESHWISYGLAGILFGKAVEVPYVHRPVAIAASSLAHYVGQYGAITIGQANGQLYLDSPEALLVPESACKLYQQRLPDRTVEFLLDQKGNSYAAVLMRGGVPEILRKRKAARRR
jgi:CubicO group peptidase (beta-lactamase class C family)